MSRKNSQQTNNTYDLTPQKGCNFAMQNKKDIIFNSYIFKV